jgi:NADPH:quinone reductase-like Zn-dependent oxidoreductase
MRAVVLREFGGPEKLVIEELETPEPGSEQVRIKINALGLNRSEVAIRAGKYPIPKELPVRIGFEGAGTVDALGAGVSEFSLGDRVSMIPLGKTFAEQGGYAEYALIHKDALAKTPQNVSDEESAAIWMAYLTVWAALIHQAGAKRGDSVIITAASSSLGVPAFQVCQREGMTSIACTRSPEKVSRVKDLGADHVICTSTENLAERVREITGGKGANLAFDCVAGPGIKEIIKSMAFDGKIVIYGMLDSRPMEIIPMTMMPKRLSLLTHMIFNEMDDLTTRRNGVAYVTSGVNEGIFKPEISKVFDFTDIAKAHEYMQSNEQVGKIVVRV